jgi:hypothetical protein
MFKPLVRLTAAALSFFAIGHCPEFSAAHFGQRFPVR